MIIDRYKIKYISLIKICTPLKCSIYHYSVTENLRSLLGASLLHTSATQWHSMDWGCLVPLDHVHGRHCGVCWTGEDGDSVLVGYAGQVSSASVVVLQPLFAQLWGEEVGEGEREQEKER